MKLPWIWLDLRVVSAECSIKQALVLDWKRCANWASLTRRRLQSCTAFCRQEMHRTAGGHHNKIDRDIRSSFSIWATLQHVKELRPQTCWFEYSVCSSFSSAYFANKCSMGQRSAVIWWFTVELPIEGDLLSAYRVLGIFEALLSLVAMFIALSSVVTR